MSAFLTGLLETLVAWDRALFREINSNWTNAAFDWLMPLITDLHKIKAFSLGVAPLAVAIWAWRMRGHAVKVAVAVGLAFAVSDAVCYRVIKKSIMRDRPEAAGLSPQLRAPSAAGPSFPSNHASNVFAWATVIWLAHRRWSWIFLAYAAAVAYSRVYVGVHFPLDVAFGALLGSTIGWASWRALKKWIVAPGWRWPRRSAEPA